MDDAHMAEIGLDILEGIADVWAKEAGLFDMITNATSPMLLKRGAPDDVRASFHDRMKSQVFAIAQQAFIEGALRGVDLVNDEIRSMRDRGELTITRNAR